MVATGIILGIATFVSIGALVATIICVAIPVWDTTSVDVTITRTITQHTYSGIWSTCVWEEVKDHSSFDCTENTNDSSLQATQAMTLIATAACAGVVVLCFLKCCLFKENKILSISIIILCIAAAVFLMIGAIIFGADVSTDVSNLNAGFAICLCAAGLIIAVAILMICLVVCCD